MNNNPYSYDECLAIIDFCIGLERHTRLTPELDVARILGVNTINKILEMNHCARIALMAEAMELIR